MIPARDPRYSRIPRIKGRKLQEIRKRWFHRNPLCVLCEQQGRVSPATELDHILRMEDGGADADSNRQGLCHDCHLSKTLREKHYDERPRIGADGWPQEERERKQ